jgi:hypothetical protein
VNDLEAKLRNLTFREPPPGLRGAVLANARAPGWKNWLAPHPAAWLALAALWIALVVLDSLLNAPAEPSSRDQIARVASPRQTPVLLAFYQQSGAIDLAR